MTIDLEYLEDLAEQNQQSAPYRALAIRDAVREIQTLRAANTRLQQEVDAHRAGQVVLFPELLCHPAIS